MLMIASSLDAYMIITLKNVAAPHQLIQLIQLIQQIQLIVRLTKVIQQFKLPLTKQISARTDSK